MVNKTPLPNEYKVVGFICSIRRYGRTPFYNSYITLFYEALAYYLVYRTSGYRQPQLQPYHLQ